MWVGVRGGREREDGCGWVDGWSGVIL